MAEEDDCHEEWGNPEWWTYQNIVAGLHAKGDEDRIVKTEYEITLPGSGSKEIDVYVKDTPDRYTYETLIECKFHGRAIPQSFVDSVNGYLNECGADKGVIVSKNGFQSGAIERATGTGIELWTRVS